MLICAVVDALCLFQLRVDSAGLPWRGVLYADDEDGQTTSPQGMYDTVTTTLCFLFVCCTSLRSTSFVARLAELFILASQNAVCLCVYVSGC